MEGNEAIWNYVYVEVEVEVDIEVSRICIFMHLEVLLMF